MTTRTFVKPHSNDRIRIVTSELSRMAQVIQENASTGMQQTIEVPVTKGEFEASDVQDFIENIQSRGWTELLTG